MNRRQLAGLIVTLLAGLSGGALFVWLSIPLPWVLGSAAATAILSRTSLPAYLPPQARTAAIVVVGTMLGAGFDQNIVARLIGWIPSVLVMLGLSLLFFAIPYAIQRRFSTMDRATAFLSAVPGGLSVVTALADDYDADVRRIALAHTARIVVLLLMTPMMLGWVADYDLGGVAREMLTHMEWGSAHDLAILAVCAIAGYALARVSAVPSAALLFPLILSAVLHATGVVTAHVPVVVSILAQVVIGANIGLRFAGYPRRDLIRDGWLAAGSAVILSLTAFAGAWAYGYATGQPVPPLLLAFLPGGAPELGVVALALGIDPALVAAHHLVRVMVIAASIPFVLKMTRGEDPSRHK